MGEQLIAGDLAELRHLVDRYADAVDARDEAAFRAVFTPDGVLRVQADDGPVEREWSGPGLAGSFEPLQPYRRTFHHVGGAVFEAVDEGATGRVVCLAHHYQGTGSGPVDLVMMIRYHDRYARAEAGWLIQERRVAVQWTELHPAHPTRRPAR